MRRAIERLWRDEEGTASVEYAFLVAVIAVGCVGAWTGLSTRLTAVVDSIGASVQGDAASP